MESPVLPHLIPGGDDGESEAGHGPLERESPHKAVGGVHKRHGRKHSARHSTHSEGVRGVAMGAMALLGEHECVCVCM